MRKWFGFIFIAIFLNSCKEEKKYIQVENVGYAQGSTFQIKYLSENGKDYEEDIQSIFKSIDQSMSTYADSSLISLINIGDTVVEVDSLLIQVLERSLQIAEETGGLFDPTIGPLVNVWGFGKTDRTHIDTSVINSVKRFTGYENIKYLNKRTVELPRGFALDFNAIAQGFTVDVIAEFLKGKGISDYMVEVGGEVRANGKNADGEIWRIGIDKPSDEIDEQDRFQIIISLKNAALVTSGNYRKFWVDEESGAKYAHTIDPKTGYPAKNRLLSVSVIASTAMDADAYATVCMVKGVREAIDFLSNKKSLEGYLIYTNEDGEWETYQTDGFEEYILK